MTPRRIVDDYLAAKTTMASAASPMGRQLEAMRLGTEQASTEWARYAASDARHRRFALLIKCWSEVAQEHRRLLIAARTPIGAQEYDRRARKGDLIFETDADSTFYRTRAGEEVISEDEDGVFVVVRGTKAVYPTHRDLAQMLGLSTRQVRSRISEAYKRIRNSEAFAALTLGD